MSAGPLETRAAVLHAFGAPHRIETVEVRAPGPGEVRVRVAAAGVCHSDVGAADGEWDHVLPVVLGHEGSGVIESVGEGVRGLHPGQRVVLNLAPGCGVCPHCAVGRPILCQASLAAMGEGRLTTGDSPLRLDGAPVAAYSLLACFAEHCVVAARSAIPLPDGVSAQTAAVVGCAVITGLGAAVETLAVPAGSRGAVVGAGGVGVNAIQGARVRGAAEVVALDPSAERREWATRLGATSTLDPADGDVAARLRRDAPDTGFDWSIVTVGAPEAIRLGVEIVRPGGTCCVVGLAPQGSAVPVDMLDLVTYERRIVGSAYGSLTPAVLVPRILALHAAGALQLDALVSHAFALEDVDEAFALSRAAQGLRSALTIGPAW
jgi:S-(hydroxymethyl)glutathione dehydrogenase/alcohol dehydrogenase